MKDRSTKHFLADAKLRPITEIVDQADLIYRYILISIDKLPIEAI